MSFSMFSLIYPLHFAIITIFIISIHLSLSYGSYDEYKNCSSLVSCGSVTNIGYPFWGLGRPQYCGHPELQLQCPRNHNGDYPTVKISARELGIPQSFGDEEILYRILRIHKIPKRDTYTITIKLKELISNDNTCSISLNNTGLNEISLFEYSSPVQNISLVSGNESCNDHKVVADRHTIKCRSNWNVNFTFYYLQNLSDLENNKECFYFQISVPLGKELVDLRNGNGTLVNVLKQEFEVDYSKNYSNLCFKCEDSGGLCGSSTFSEFVCHCKDGTPQLSHCTDSVLKNPLASGKDKQLKLILGLAIPAGILIFIVLHVICFCKKPKFHSPRSLSRLISSDLVNSDLEINFSIYAIPVFSFGDLQEATNNFDKTQELGNGGFGIVYYGKLRDGREVAVKHLYEKNYKRVVQFTNEIEILTKLRHKNLVTLYGCSSSHSRELLLVYEFIPNGTVADHLYGEKSVSRTLSWTIRMKIAIETASALSYLHASEIIHRDVKSNNILLDHNFSVKVADFGLSRLFPFDANHVSTAPQGTPGYLDPEYHKCYKVTSKSDVYSFGVVLIELISSLPAIDISRSKSEINLSDYAVKRIQNGELDKLIDQKLGFESDFKVKRMTILVAELAFQCLQQEGEVRPSMKEVLEALKQIENAHYEAIEAEETTRNIGRTKPGSDIDVDQALRNAQEPPSPSSVFATWVSSSTASSISRGILP